MGHAWGVGAVSELFLANHYCYYDKIRVVLSSYDQNAFIQRQSAHSVVNAPPPLRTLSVCGKWEIKIIKIQNDPQRIDSSYFLLLEKVELLIQISK